MHPIHAHRLLAWTHHHREWLPSEPILPWCPSRHESTHIRGSIAKLSMRCEVDALLHTEFPISFSPLHDVLERVYTYAGKRTKKVAGRISLDNLGWAPELMAAFAACKSAIASRVTLANLNDSHRLFIYTRASDTYWSEIFTEVPHADMSLPHSEQWHEPLAFYSGRFSAVQLSCSTMIRIHTLCFFPSAVLIGFPFAQMDSICKRTTII